VAFFWRSTRCKCIVLEISGTLVGAANPHAAMPD
jgi:hypothetical protein